MQKQNTPAPRLAPHIEEIARALRAKVDGKRGGLHDADTTIRRQVARLATLAGTRRLVRHSATFIRALTELQGKELPHASQRREVESRVAVIARWLDLAHVLPQPSPKPKPGKRAAATKRIKGVRRLRAGNWLERYGIESGDKILVAMNGDIRPGELGYFEVHKVYGHGTGTHLCGSRLSFLFERDGDCRQEGYYPQDGVCLRTHAETCDGLHVGSREEPTAAAEDFNFGIEHSAVPLGRVVVVERDGQPIETSLNIRPYDEREEPTPTQFKTTAAPVSDEQREKLLAAVRHFGPVAIEELLRLVAEGEHSKAEILRRVRKLIKKPEKDGRVEELRERLRELRNEGEAHNESGIFKLEREIYDLERGAKAGDWPDWIPG